ncbi:ATP-binding cassette domain-containing protein [Clavibacter nebraskensis]|uniref:ABC transporter ATP-binding protein n=2 Tax=Clavibacter nebraskensis TaxID=31963 RepID=A0A399QMM4_9MICO|nr:ABC transporter ATP-binding protein [Clavibacter nebraskensis]KXU21642.1 ABC transporter ATP-binding protein [Clavibacter nebraskensis]OAH22559.1 ABC transporter ATP-binding protein [Clavibacter nebraskensis]QGV65786.1 ABC transporter ATP-binding protein [Clavibacter nebraskensis]QGV68580.1 ABC transporter ATP-binding protein [Clavibacter nebraskensis]QGV71371.1 ABC transporter ATP-binding protein [Clavibacter nebraskensis]
MSVLRVSDLQVRYRGFTLGPVDLVLERGDFASLIGPNGSGKSTLIRAALGLEPGMASGTVEILGQPALRRPRQTFSRVSYVTDSPRDVLAEFTAREYWDYCRIAFESARGEPIEGWDERADVYAAMLDFPADQRRPISALSLGTARKAQIIAALLPAPDLVVLDEPFIGLDFIASRAFEALLLQLKQSQVSVLASSHDLDLAARVANRILVLREGRLLLDEQVSALTGGVEEAVICALASARTASS